MNGNEFLKFRLAQAETNAAHADYNHASVALELAQIKERLAEMASQHDPLAALRDPEMSEHDKHYGAAHYVVFGKIPTIKGQHEANRSKKQECRYPMAG